MLKFPCFTNNHDEVVRCELMDLKGIFCKQLPEMGDEYVTKVVYDKKHRSILVKRNGSVCGGVCFRPFHEQGFAEIVFCAITHDHKCKGYGTRLMNHLKEWCRQNEIYHLLTCADNNAVGYFRKAGFSQQIVLPEEIYVGYIKDYFYTTLMECVLRVDINYTRVQDTIKWQRGHIYRKMMQFKKRPILYQRQQEQKAKRPRVHHEVALALALALASPVCLLRVLNWTSFPEREHQFCYGEAVISAGKSGIPRPSPSHSFSPWPMPSLLEFGHHILEPYIGPVCSCACRCTTTPPS